MSPNESPPFLVLTVVLDASARPAAVTRSHGDALERALCAVDGQSIAGLELVELPIPPQAFSEIRRHLDRGAETVGLYDLFPLSGLLEPSVRKIAGQFLAAEALWTLEEQGILAGVPLNLKLEVPSGWSREPKSIHAKLVDAGALDLSASGVETFKRIKTVWDKSVTA